MKSTNLRGRSMMPCQWPAASLSRIKNLRPTNWLNTLAASDIMTLSLAQACPLKPRIKEPTISLHRQPTTQRWAIFRQLIRFRQVPAIKPILTTICQAMEWWALKEISSRMSYWVKSKIEWHTCLTTTMRLTPSTQMLLELDQWVPFKEQTTKVLWIWRCILRLHSITSTQTKFRKN